MYIQMALIMYHFNELLSHPVLKQSKNAYQNLPILVTGLAKSLNFPVVIGKLKLFGQPNRKSIDI